MHFAAAWMDLEIVILSEANQRKAIYDITYMWNLKKHTNELTYKTDSQIWKTVWLPKGKCAGEG